MVQALSELAKCFFREIDHLDGIISLGRMVK